MPAGRWAEQRVTGVIWLTEYQSGEAAHSPQAIGTADGGTLILWQKSSRDEDSLYAMKIDRKGKRSALMKLGLALRLNRQDRLLRLRDRIYLIATAMERDESRLYFVQDDS